MAASQYRSGGIDPTVRLLLSADPQRYLDGATVLERAGSHQATAVAGYARRLGSVRQIRERAEDDHGTAGGHRVRAEEAPGHGGAEAGLRRAAARTG